MYRTVGMTLIAIAIAIVPPRLACAETWTLGVWNVENLSPDVKRGFPELMGGSQLNPRTSSQLRKIGDYIKNNLDADALMLSEIYVTHEDGGVARNSQLDKITDRLGDEWEYSMGTTGGKSLALLYNTERVRVKKIGEFSGRYLHHRRAPRDRIQGPLAKRPHDASHLRYPACRGGR